MHQLFAKYVSGLLADDETTPSIRQIREFQRNRLLNLSNELVQAPSKSDVASLIAVYNSVRSHWINKGIVFSLTESETIGLALQVLGKFSDSVSWFDWALAKTDTVGRADQITPVVKGQFEHFIGLAYLLSGEFSKARTWFEQSVLTKDTACPSIDPESLSDSLHELGICRLLDSGEYDAAMSLFKRAALLSQVAITVFPLIGRVWESLSTRWDTYMQFRAIMLKRCNGLEKPQTTFKRAVVLDRTRQQSRRAFTRLLTASICLETMVLLYKRQ